MDQDTKERLARDVQIWHPENFANKEHRLTRGRFFGAVFASLMTLSVWRAEVVDDGLNELEAETLCEQELVFCDAASSEAVLAHVEPVPIEPEATTTEPPAPTTTSPPTTAPPSPAAVSRLFAAHHVPDVGLGIDVSYPNCNVPIPEGATFGIVGVNGGRPFKDYSFKNVDCFLERVDSFRSRNLPVTLYANTNYPGINEVRMFQNGPKKCAETDNNCIAYNYGYAAGVFAVDLAHKQGVESDFWWLDVETANSWRGTHEEHRQSLSGQLDAVRDKTNEYYDEPAGIGFYSVPRMWQIITGDWKNGFPNWVASGTNRPEAAKPSCAGKDFTGGGTRMVQYVTHLDHNLPC